LLERGCIVDAIASHGDNIADCLVRADDSQFVLWGNPGVNGCLGGDCRQLAIVQPIEFRAADYAINRRFEQPQASGDRRGSRYVVACDHGNADARSPTFPDRRQNLGPRWICEANKPQEL
jgi:hypothetical protein